MEEIQKTSGLPIGIYEQLIYKELEALIAGQPHASEIVKVDGPGTRKIAFHVAKRVEQAIRQIPNDKAVSLAQNLLAVIGSNEALADPVTELKALAPSEHKLDSFTHPINSLNEHLLLTNSKHEPGLGQSLAEELVSADSVDVISAFVRMTGIRNLFSEFADLQDRGVRVRLITSVYLGATERRAVDVLAKKYGVEVKINYDTEFTRLHAKAWLIGRKSGFGTAYVGSSNLSKAALVDGLEWNVRLSQNATPEILQKFKDVFDSYWNSPEFVSYDPDADQLLLQSALERAAGGRSTESTVFLSGLDVTPRPHQIDMLRDLELARTQMDRHRNLVVAATGTGKTVLAALDYQRLSSTGQRKSLLFVAHRKEILNQAMQTFREVLKDPNFGELWVDGFVPKVWRHVFASIQSISASGADVDRYKDFDVVYVDEFHHAPAKSYSSFIKNLDPEELVGLTATPERADGVSVQDEFFDGRITSELRLWDALDLGLLVPFHYFGISDPVNLSGAKWAQGKYDVSEITNLFTANDLRNREALRAINEYVADIDSLKALAFCVSVDHAEDVNSYFNGKGLRSACVTGMTPAAERAQAIQDLKTGTLQVICSVDVFNEGVDIPEIDTILMLRPTESPVLFLQQLGRGLRRTSNKSVLTVLDLVGVQHAKYRMDRKLGALTGLHRGELVKAADNGFPYLPSGTQIKLEKQAQAAVLAGLKAQIGYSKKKLVSEVRSVGLSSLEKYLVNSGRELAEIYKKSSWHKLCSSASLLNGDNNESTSSLNSRIKRFVHIDDLNRLKFYRELISGPLRDWEEYSRREKYLMSMFFWNLFPQGGISKSNIFNDYLEGIELARGTKSFSWEFIELLDVLEANQTSRSHNAVIDSRIGPLVMHCTYNRAELLAATNYANLLHMSIGEKQEKSRIADNHQAGVWRDSVSNSEILMVTLKKDEAKFSASVRYADYAITQSKFHWESQNSKSPTSKAGRVYVDQATNGLELHLCIRETADGELGGEPYVYLGRTNIQSAEGAKPMQIVMDLEEPMPLEWYLKASIVAV